MDDLLKQQVKAIVDKALKDGFDQNGKWKEESFLIVFNKESGADINQISTIIFEYLGSIKNDRSNPNAGKAGKLLEEMRDFSGRDEFADKADFTRRVNIGSVFPILTDTKPTNPKTTVTFPFDYGKTTIQNKDEFLANIDKLKKDYGVEFSFFPQIADVDDKSPADKFDLSKTEDLNSYLIQLLKKKDKYSEQDIEIFKEMKLALGRSLVVSQLDAFRNNTIASEIQIILNKDDPQAIWEELKNRGNIKEVGGKFVSDLANLAPDMNDKDKARATTSTKTFEIKRKQVGFEKEDFDGDIVSFGGVIEKNGTIPKTPEGALKTQRERSIEEIKDIREITNTIKGENTPDIFDGFNEERKRVLSKPIVKPKQDEKPIEKPEEPKTKETKPTKDGVRFRANREQGDTPAFLYLEYKGEEIQPPKKIFPNWEDVNLLPDFDPRKDKNGLAKTANSPGVKTLRAVADAGTDVINLVTRVPLYVLTTLNNAQKKWRYNLTKIEENDDLDKETVRQISEKIRNSLEGLSPNEPKLDKFNFAELEISTIGNYGDKKHNDVAERKYIATVAQISAIFNAELEYLEKLKILSPENEQLLTTAQKEQLKKDFEAKISDEHLLIRHTNTPGSDEKINNHKNKGNIRFFETEEDAKRYLRNEITFETISAINRIIEHTRNGNSTITGEEAEKIFSDYITKHNLSGIISIQKTNESYYDVTVEPTVSIEELRKYHQFINDEFRNPLSPGKLPRELANRKIDGEITEENLKIVTEAKYRNQFEEILKNSIEEKVIGAVKYEKDEINKNEFVDLFRFSTSDKAKLIGLSLQLRGEKVIISYTGENGNVINNEYKAIFKEENLAPATRDKLQGLY
jgi:hypothetical protein